jgi:YVTN family beta-propeller protein
MSRLHTNRPGVLGAVILALGLTGPPASAAPGLTPQPTSSSPIAITPDDRLVWAVNPENDSVSVFAVAGDTNVKVAEIPVGVEPQCVAVNARRHKVYVTNAVSGTVSVIRTKTMAVVRTITVGADPFGCALTRRGTRQRPRLPEPSPGVDSGGQEPWSRSTE